MSTVRDQDSQLEFLLQPQRLQLWARHLLETHEPTIRVPPGYEIKIGVDVQYDHSRCSTRVRGSVRLDRVPCRNKGTSIRELHAEVSIDDKFSYRIGKDLSHEMFHILKPMWEKMFEAIHPWVLMLPREKSDDS